MLRETVTMADATAANTDGASTTSPKRVYSMVDLFAGCGGLSLGFENASFTPVFVNELHQDAPTTSICGATTRMTCRASV